MTAKVTTSLVALLVVLLFGACSTSEAEPPPSSHPWLDPVPASVTSLTPGSRATSLVPSIPELPGVRITRVIDGDTFELSNQARVRVLGIDSCEMSTPGGAEAKEAAERLLQGAPINLVPEPSAPDKDRYGRLLRYVRLANGNDFGGSMAIFSHTGVYQGRNDASPDYVAGLRAMDSRSGRDCGEAEPPARVERYATEDDHHYVPTPRHDGGESRFCGKRWWC